MLSIRIRFKMVHYVQYTIQLHNLACYKSIFKIRLGVTYLYVI